MSDLISREEVLKIVDEALNKNGRLKFSEAVLCNNWLIEEINKLLPQNKWISIKDKEPKINEKVLCLTKGGEVYVDKYNSLEEEFILEHLKCTHWQPLPQPPLLDK